MKEISSKICLLFLLLMLCVNSALAGPFIKIDKIDADSDFPRLKIFMTAKNIDTTIIRGLNDNNISVYEDGYRINYLKVLSYEERNDFLYLMFSIDSSKSISEKYLNNLKKAALEIINNTRSGDKIAIYKFNNEVLMMNNFTDNRAELIKNISNVRRHGKKTLLFDSIYDSIHFLREAQGSRRAIIVFTDGKDEGSSITIPDIIKDARKFNMPIYFICLKTSSNIKQLARISKLTDGKLIYSTNAANIAGMYQTIINMIHSQYIVQFPSMFNRDGKKHNIEVRLKYGKIRDRDINQVTYKKGPIDIRLPSLAEVILIVLIIILIALLVYILIYFIKKNNRVFETILSSTPTHNREYQEIKKTIDNTEQKKYQQDRVMTADDPEYIYSRAWLVVKDGANVGEKFPIFWDEVTIGRNDENTIVVQDKSVSLKHASIKMVKNAYYLFDQVSDNGTYLNEKKLLRPKALYDWDEIKIGRTLFIFRGSKVTS